MYGNNRQEGLLGLAKQYRFLIVGVVASVLLLGFWVFAVKAVKPDQNHEAVLIKQPILPWFEEGVDTNPVKPGRTYVLWTTKAIMVNTQPQQHRVHFEDLMSLDGVPLDFDAVLRLKVIDSVFLIKNFGEEWYKNNVEMEFMNRVRQAVRKHGMNETAIDTKAIDDIDKEVSEAMTAYIKATKLPLLLVDVTVGKANPPDAIKNQRIETAKEQQRQLTEQQRKLAEDTRKQAEQSRAEADNAYRETMNLNPSQFIQLKDIEMKEKVCGKDGKANCNFFVGGSSSPVPIVDAGKK